MKIKRGIFNDILLSFMQNVSYYTIDQLLALLFVKKTMF